MNPKRRRKKKKREKKKKKREREKKKKKKKKKEKKKNKKKGKKKRKEEDIAAKQRSRTAKLWRTTKILAHHLKPIIYRLAELPSKLKHQSHAAAVQMRLILVHENSLLNNVKLALN